MIYLKICLVDDDSVQLELLKSLINKWTNKKNIVSDLTFFQSAEEMLFECEGNYPYDLLILDIQMGKINGIELAREIRKTDKNIIICFLSGISSYVYEGYEVNAIRYLLKPVKEEKLFEILNIAEAQTKKEEKYIIINLAGEKKKINYNEILYVESLGHYLILHAEKDEFEFKGNMIDISDIYGRIEM